MVNNQKIKIAVLGLGYWGPKLVRAFQSDDRVSQVIGIESNPERRELISQQDSKLSIASSLDACLNDNSIEAFVIATPTETHYSLGLKCLQAQKHLFIEKPLSHNSESAKHLVNLAREKKRILMTGHIFLYNQAVWEIKESIQSGELGDIIHIKSIRTNLGPIRSDVNALWDLATHDLSIFDYIFNRPPVKVSCSAVSLLGLEQEDIAIGSLEYGSDQTATFLVSWFDPVKTRKITIIGNEKTLVFDDMQSDEPLTIYNNKVSLVSSNFDFNSEKVKASFVKSHVGSTYSVPVIKREPLREECREFISCIFSGQNPQSDGEKGLRIVRQLEALVKSYSQQGVSINL